MTDNGTAAIVTRINDALEAHPTLNQKSLAELIGFDKSKMSKLLSGQRSISAAEAAAIADALGQSATWIVTGRRPTAPRPRAVAARLASEAPADLAGPSRRASELLEVRALLEQIVHFATPTPPAVEVSRDPMHVRAGTKCAMRLREALGLGDDPIADINELIEAHFRVDVSRQPMDADLAGLLVRDPDTDALAATAIMLINSAAPIGRQRFTAAHELAHLLFDDTGLVKADHTKHSDADWDEVRADAFAAEFLAPATGVAKVVADVIAQLGDKPADDSSKWVATLAASLAVTFGLSVESALYRAFKLGHIDDAEYTAARGRRAQDVMSDGGRRGWIDTIVEQPEVIDPPAQLTAHALGAYAEGLVGIGTMAALFASDDPEQLRAELADAGWVPAYA